jgi:hypothetical protein
MFIQNRLQITIESGTSSLSFLAENNHWYIIRDIYHEIYVDPQTNSISLEMAMRIRQLCKLSSFYLIPTLKTEILSDSLYLAPILAPYLAPNLTPYLAPIKVSLGTPEIFNIDSYN